MSAYSDKVIADGAVAYWRLNETSGTTAVDIKGGFNGTISGGVTLGQTSPLTDGNPAMRFDGILGTKISIATPLTLPAACSLESWIKTTSATDQLPVFADDGAGATVFFGLKAGKPFFFHGGTPNSATGGPILTDGVWHHLVVTNDATTTRFYVDGVSVYTTAQTHSSATLGWNIACWITFNNIWDGFLDEIAVYPSVLTASQIGAHYLLGVSTNRYVQQVVGDGAVAYWRLGETSGTTAVDSIGGNNGTISGGVTLNQPGATTDGNPAMTFNGSTGKIVTSSFTFSASYSVEVWLKTSVYGATWPPLFSTRTTNAAPQLFLGMEGDHLYFLLHGGASPISGTRIIEDGNWHHVVCIVTPTAQSIYVDGVLDKTVANTQSGALTATVRIGWDEPNAAFWNGLLDDVAIYPSALTPTQIAAHYATGVSSLTSPFVFLDEDESMVTYNLWTAVTPSDTTDLPRLTDGLWVGTGGNLVAVMQNNTTLTFAVPSGGWLPIAARRVNSTNTTATGIVALNAV